MLIRAFVPYSRGVQLDVCQCSDASFDSLVEGRVAQIFSRLYQVSVEKPYLDVSRLEPHERTALAFSENTFSSQCGIPLRANHLTCSMLIGEYPW